MNASISKKFGIYYIISVTIVSLLVYDIYLRAKENKGFFHSQDKIQGLRRATPDSPEAEAIQAAYIKASSILKYAPFIALQKGKWTLAQEERLTELFAQRALDSSLIARQRGKYQGISDHASAQAEPPTDAAISTEFTADTLIAVRHFEQTMQQRNRLLPMIQVLLYDKEELSVTELENLVKIMQENAAIPLRLDASITEVDSALEAARKGNEKVLSRAEGYLSPTQLARLKSVISAEEAYLKYFRYRRAHVAPTT